MLLRHTPEEITERSALTINPAKTCQPIGAMYAALGIHNCLPHSHGSQGCYAYHRSTLSRHFKEPAIAATSAFTEGASVFGGQANLLQAINNIFTVYEPDVIAVHTTCLSETIGDDIPQIVAKARDEGKIPPGKYVIHANTPSYVGSHVTGFANMVKGMVDYFAQANGHKENRINIIPGYVEPSDMEEIKHLAGELGVSIIMFPDTSNVMNGPQTGKYHMYPAGGTTMAGFDPGRQQYGHGGPGPPGLRTGGPGPGHQVQGALRNPEPAHRADGHRHLHRHLKKDRRGQRCPTPSISNGAGSWTSSPTCSSTFMAAKWPWRGTRIN